MGAKQSSPELSLAEKRYRVSSPKSKRRSRREDGALRIRAAPSIRSERAPSPDPFSLPTNSVQHSKSAIDVGTATRLSPNPSESSPGIPPLSPFFADQQDILNKAQKHLIETSWKRARKTGADNVGAKIFLLILTAEPDMRMIFGLEKVPQGRLKYDPRFRKHASVFTKSFDYVVKNLDFVEKLAQHFQTLGKKHVQLQSRGFQTQYWDVFAECMTQTAIEWEAGRKCRETMGAWRLLVGFIIKHMRIGFDREKQIRKRFSASIMGMPTIMRSQSNSMSQKPLIHTHSNDLEGLKVHSNNERSASWFAEEREFSEEFGKLKLKTGCPERDLSPSSGDFFTPPSTRRREEEKKFFSRNTNFPT
ncbi:unnamed protein product [Bursaphelenchus xylophilus]|uniref:(pine wood nematode) hypothetical protein n=1 Tax=Bursaphelenchus xylophilus TaxID=6326 RepID=A0A1I7SLK7_BURXY|nr:unnamed protein product [Bursaphelenchus xylophilus]CAG9129655.1 unnamed protein product [Bursaphelenchus xylophilus]